MKIQAITHSVLTSGTLEKRVFYMLAVVLLMLSFFYAYFVNETVMNVVARKDVQTQMVDLSSAVSELEFQYMNYKNTITLDYSRSLGFFDTDEKIFISRRSSDTRLTLQQ